MTESRLKSLSAEHKPSAFESYSACKTFKAGYNLSFHRP
jgi:hypothetical protein